jgi:hypothetical protein
MGNRANFVIVENHDWRLYYSHWAGCRILDALIGGPELALRYVQSLRPCTKADWVDPTWADGGAVLDLDQRRLLFFGEELMMASMSERRALMAVLPVLWPDFEVGWAYDGTVEVAGYVGAELPPYRWDREPGVRRARDRNAVCHLVSVRDEADELRMWPLRCGLSKAWRGPELLDLLPGRGVKRLALNEIPEGGVHIDVKGKVVGTWHTADTMGVFQALPDVWNGWHTECWEDRFEEHVDRCAGALRVPGVDLVAGIDAAQEWIRKRVFQSFEDSPAGHIAGLASLLAPGRPGLVVNDDAISDSRVQPREAEWARFADACNALRAARAESA